MASNSYSAGVGASAGSYSIVLDVSTGNNPGGNSSTVYWNCYLRKNSSTGFAYNLDNVTEYYVYVEGVRSNYLGKYDFRSPNNGAGATWGIASGNFPIGHDGNNGTRAITVRAYVSGPGPLTSGDTGWQTFTLDDYDLRVNTPNNPTLSRSADGGSITMSTATSTRNSGPNADYFHWYFSTDNVNWTFLKQTSPTSTNATSFTWTAGNGDAGRSPDPNTRYYFIVYAHNPDTTNNSGWTAASGSSNIFGVPSAPSILSLNRSTTDSGKVSLSWSTPSNTQGGITGYDIFVNDTYAESTTATSLTSIKINSGGTGLTPGTTYTYRVAAKNAINSSGNTVSTLTSSISSGSSVVAPGAPAAPTLPTTYTSGGLTYSNPNKMGRNVTIICNASPNDYGVSINTANAEQGYFVQYQSSIEQNGTYGSWSTPVKMSDQANRTHTYQLMDPARWYKFRVYAANTVVNNKNGTKTYYPHNSGSTANFSVETAAFFVPAAGKRFDGTEYLITNIAKRYNPITSSWQDISIAKRYNSVQDVWEDLT